MLDNHLVTKDQRRLKQLLTVLSVSAFLIVFLQIQIDQIRSSAQKVEEFRFLPSGDFLRAASLGYSEFGADLLWLRAIQFMGGKDQTGKGYDWLYHVLDVVTDLDPKFFEAYQIGSTVLSVLGDRADQSVLLLNKGVTHITERWELYFNLGFNYFYFLDDFKNAAISMEKASKLSGSPPYIAGLTAKLYAESQSPETALNFVQALYSTVKDPGIRQRLKNTLDTLVVKATLNELNTAVQKFLLSHPGETPSISRLLNLGYLLKAPTEPLGGVYYWDEARRAFHTTSRIEEPKVFIDEAGRGRK